MIDSIHNKQAYICTRRNNRECSYVE